MQDTGLSNLIPDEAGAGVDCQLTAHWAHVCVRVCRQRRHYRINLAAEAGFLSAASALSIPGSSDFLCAWSESRVQLFNIKKCAVFCGHVESSVPAALCIHWSEKNSPVTRTEQNETTYGPMVDTLLGPLGSLNVGPGGSGRVLRNVAVTYKTATIEFCGLL